MKFSKLHGTGNDFIITGIDEINRAGVNIPDMAKAICDRHFGIGADGMMFHMESELADIKMKYYNSDGSKAEMCGNGIRCFARYVYKTGVVEKNEFKVETDAGIYNVQIHGECMVEVEMGLPDTEIEKIPASYGREGKFLKEEIKTELGRIEASSVRMGVPHTVVFNGGNESRNVEKMGRAIENLKEVFPEGTNVNFARMISSSSMEVVTWERGAGRTLSCGTGVCASAYLANLFGLSESELEVRVPGGKLTVRIETDSLFMKGEAVWVCNGDFVIEKC